MAWSMNKVMYVGAGVYVLDQSWASSTCSQSFRVPTNKHHDTGLLWCPNPDHYLDSELAGRSLNYYVLTVNHSSRTSKKFFFFFFFVWHGPELNNEPPACQANAQPPQYLTAVKMKKKGWLNDIKWVGSLFKLETFQTTQPLACIVYFVSY